MRLIYPCSVLDFAAEGSRTFARSLSQVSQRTRVQALPHFYRIIRLHDCDALSNFLQHIHSNQSLALFVQHLWIAHPDIARINDFMHFTPRRRGAVPLKERARRETMTRRADAVIGYCPNLLSLAIHGEIYKEGWSRINLLEFITDGDGGRLRWDSVPQAGSHFALRRISRT
jgi:hypothetical protein